MPSFLPCVLQQRGPPLLKQLLWILLSPTHYCEDSTEPPSTAQVELQLLARDMRYPEVFVGRKEAGGQLSCTVGGGRGSTWPSQSGR